MKNTIYTTLDKKIDDYKTNSHYMRRYNRTDSVIEGEFSIVQSGYLDEGIETGHLNAADLLVIAEQLFRLQKKTTEDNPTTYLHRIKNLKFGNPVETQQGFSLVLSDDGEKDGYQKTMIDVGEGAITGQLYWGTEVPEESTASYTRGNNIVTVNRLSKRLEKSEMGNEGKIIENATHFYHPNSRLLKNYVLDIQDGGKMIGINGKFASHGNWYQDSSSNYLSPSDTILAYNQLALAWYSEQRPELTADQLAHAGMIAKIDELTFNRPLSLREFYGTITEKREIVRDTAIIRKTNVDFGNNSITGTVTLAYATMIGDEYQETSNANALVPA